MTIATLIKKKASNWDWLLVQRLSPLSLWQKPFSMQADMVLEKELRVLHLDLQVSGRKTGVDLSH